MVSSYTANLGRNELIRLSYTYRYLQIFFYPSLAAFLTIEVNLSPINTAEDLAGMNGKIMYGAKRGGSTISFFGNSDYGVYKEMGDYMSKHPEMLTSSNFEGVERVKNQNYAFLMESTSIEYTVERECDVSQVGGMLDEKGYGIAMRKSKYPFHCALSEIH